MAPPPDQCCTIMNDITSTRWQNPYQDIFGFIFAEEVGMRRPSLFKSNCACCHANGSYGAGAGRRWVELRSRLFEVLFEMCGCLESKSISEKLWKAAFRSESALLKRRLRQSRRKWSCRWCRYRAGGERPDVTWHTSTASCCQRPSGSLETTRNLLLELSPVLLVPLWVCQFAF